MKKYVVYQVVSYVQPQEVEAENEEQATKLALESGDWQDQEDVDYTYEVYPIREKK